MRTRFERAPGVSFQAISLQTGYLRGVEIDNPSGSWLYIPSNETFIPPYTIGWTFGWPYDVAAFNIIAQNGPSGQLSTSAGDNVVVYLTDIELPTVAGTAYIGKLEQPDSFELSFAYPGPGWVQTTSSVLFGSLVKRIRIFRIFLFHSNLFFQGRLDYQLILSLTQSLPPTPRIGGPLTVNPNVPADSYEFAQPIDLRPGNEIVFTFDSEDPGGSAKTILAGVVAAII